MTSTPKQQPRYRSWCFTINNPTADDEEAVTRLAALEANYLIVGKERGTNGTDHFQGYVNLLNAKTFQAMHKKLPRSHLEIAKGTASENRTYCTKENNIILEHGTCPAQGKKSDIAHAREHIEQGGNMRSMVDVARSYQAIRVAEIYLKYHEPERDWKPEVRWYHGSTGAGKTKQAREWLNEDIYTCLNDAKWFEGYDAHPNVLIDDFRKDFAKFHVLLKMLDRYPYRVETKGGSRQFLARRIAITSPYPPQFIYNNREDVLQLIRRIDEIIQVGNLVEPEKFKCIDEENYDPID